MFNNPQDMTYVPMHKRTGVIWLNGEMINWKDAQLHVLTHCLHYGSGVFEGIRSYNGKLFKAKEHYERLLYSAKVVGLENNYIIDDLIAITYELLLANNLQDAYIRPIIYKGSETTKLNGKCSSQIVIAAWELKNYHSSDGLKVTWSKYKKASSDYMPVGAKISGLYVLNMIIKNSISSEFDDAILLDENNYVTECTTSNLFIVKNGKLLTPIADCFLNGITRQTIIEIIPSCEEVRLTKEDVLNADEIFVTGTAIGIMPIIQIDQKHFSIGLMTKEILSLYDKKIN